VEVTIMANPAYEEIMEKCKEAVEKVSRREMYMDILYDSSSLTQIYKDRTDEELVVYPLMEGFVVRGYKGGTWREFGLQDLEQLEEVIGKLKKMNSSVKNPVSLREFEAWTVNKEIKGEIPPESISIDEKVEQVRGIYDELKKMDERVINLRVVYSDSTMERIFVNNEGCVLRQKLPRTRLYMQPIVKEGNRVEFDYFSESGERGFELIHSIRREDLQQIVNNSLELLKAEKSPSGTFPVIVDPDMAGLIAHESFGHGLEADQILRDRSYLKKFLHKPVASQICNLGDSPLVKGNIGSFFFDDEGIRVLHDRYTASAMNLPPGGNGRRESYANKLHVRMTNTFFEAGDFELDELMEGIKYGVMLIRGFYGMEDPLAGGMQVTSKKGYLIEKGEITKLLGSITLSGYVLDVLKSIDAVGKGPLQFRGGTCGKGHEDYVPVTTGGPHFRAQKAVVGPA
jgi:TldD protein